MIEHTPYTKYNINYDKDAARLHDRRREWRDQS
jgi:hypothetical protein